MKQRLIIIIIGVLFFSGTTSADKTDKLIQLLVNKKIVTSEEAKAIVEELDGENKTESDSEKITATAKSSFDSNEKVEVKYDKGAVIKTTDDLFSLKLNARLHGSFYYLDPENSPSSLSFLIRRARILASGNAFYPWLKYSTQITLEGRETIMRDAFVEASYFEWMTSRLGQYKVPFDREFLNGGFNLQLVDRSISSIIFSLQRDIGFQISGKKIFNNFEYSAGIFNGSGANSLNVDDDLMYVGRMVWAPFGSYPYRESAVDNPSSPRLAIGIAGAYMPGLEPGERATLAGRLGNTSIVPVESDVFQWTMDFAYKYQGFSLMSGYHYRNISPGSLTPFGEQDAWGFYIQSGFFIIPENFEVAGRYAYADPDNPSRISDNEQTEITFGLNYYFQGHNVKTGLNYSLYSTEKQLGNENNHSVKGSLIVQF